MATLSLFDTFVGDICGGVHDLLGTGPTASPPDCDTLKVYLTNATPAGTETIKANIAEITNQNGYAAPIAITNNGTNTTGTVTINGLSVQVVATGAVGPFTYVVLYNDTPTSPADPLIAWADYGGTGLTLADGETFDIKFNNAAVGARGTIMTIT